MSDKMNTKVNDKKKGINILHMVLSVVRKTLGISLVITQLIISTPFFIAINLLLGSTICNKFLDDIVLKRKEFFSDERQN